ncbi:MFS transporter [Stenotrophomonas maltophilia]|uniref:MFS transporter n=1 Tax=Stenotrophomonas maltophilia TaxID=40324 RepID=UPI002E77476C|nr:MFS transporter [Stenotrophomonas maltophilia]
MESDARNSQKGRGLPDRAEPARRGQTIGRLISGLSAGTLLARTISGYVGAHAGWRVMFELAAVIDVALITLVWHYLPHSEPSSDLTYPQLLASLGQLLLLQRPLQEACVLGFPLFAAFNLLWGTLALILARPLRLRQRGRRAIRAGERRGYADVSRYRPLDRSLGRAPGGGRWRGVRTPGTGRRGAPSQGAADDR